MKKLFIKPPFLSTSFSEDGKRAKKRFVNILNTRVKRAGTVTAVVAMTLTLALGSMVACGKTKNTQDASINTTGVSGSLEDALAEALLEENDKYAETEFWSEGHIVLGSEAIAPDSDGYDRVRAYVLTKVGGYSFINGVFVAESGTGVIPAMAEFTEKEDGYVLDELRYPRDGSYYLPSIEEMFPEPYRKTALNADGYYDELLAQEQAQAVEYLKSIGRDAKIGVYADLDLQFPDISAEASNSLSQLKKYNDELNRFPDFIGTQEYIEDGKRFVYETSWDAEARLVTYDKYDEDGGVVSSCSVNTDSGEISVSAQYADGQ